MIPARTVRPATSADLDALQRIEDAADRLLIDALHPTEWEGAPTGASRAAQPGFLLVAADDGEAVGFAHVRQVDGGFHLEQLAVDPASGRRGHGRALVRAAQEEAAARGADRLTLRTYRDVPWNASFYRRCGFEVSTPDTPFLNALVDVERAAGVDRWGERVQMTAPLPRP